MTSVMGDRNVEGGDRVRSFSEGKRGRRRV
jgi:hypothetical protein